jgi:hypothetical protein
MREKDSHNLINNAPDWLPASISLQRRPYRKFEKSSKSKVSATSYQDDRAVCSSGAGLHESSSGSTEQTRNWHQVKCEVDKLVSRSGIEPETY